MAQTQHLHTEDFLQRDTDSHPPEHAPDINVFDQNDVKIVEDVPMDHPASHVEITDRWH